MFVSILILIWLLCLLEIKGKKINVEVFCIDEDWIVIYVIIVKVFILYICLNVSY